jgi:hypothetical protein
MDCDSHFVDRWTSNDNSGRQVWTLSLIDGFSDKFNIIITNGRPSCTNAFLSVRSDGSLVDLFYTDDGSGRQ